MPLMPHEVRDSEIVIGPCPGCQCWQLEYHWTVAPQVIEIALREHLEECSPLREILDTR